MRPDLLIPLSDLPGPVPEGAPRLYQTPTGDWMLWDALGRRCSSSDPDGWTWQERALTETWPVAIDLSRPPVDANGYRTRIDGADVAAGMLARAYRMDLRQLGLGVTWRHVAPGLWELSVCGWGLVFGVDGRASVIVPALADIDPTDPDAARLALAAVIKAKPWEKR